jgi:hypothetical protein
MSESHVQICPSQKEKKSKSKKGNGKIRGKQARELSEIAETPTTINSFIFVLPKESKPKAKVATLNSDLSRNDFLLHLPPNPPK